MNLNRVYRIGRYLLRYLGSSLAQKLKESSYCKNIIRLGLTSSGWCYGSVVSSGPPVPSYHSATSSLAWSYHRHACGPTCLYDHWIIVPCQLPICTQKEKEENGTMNETLRTLYTYHGIWEVCTLPGHIPSANKTEFLLLKNKKTVDIE